MAEASLSVSEVLGGGHHVGLQLGGEVVVNVLGWVGPLGLRGSGSHYEFVAQLVFGKGKGGVVVHNVGISTEVWYEVVNLVASWLLLVLVLGASSRGADWVGLEMKVNCGSEHIVGVDHVVISLFSSGSMGLAILNVSVWSEVGDKVVALWLIGWVLSLPDVSHFLLCQSCVKLSILNVVINTEMWNKVIHFWLIWLGEAGLHHVTKSGLGCGGMCFCGFHISVFAEIWDEVISWVSRSGSTDEFSELGLGGTGVLKSLLNIPVLTEVWHEISSWWLSWSFE